MARSRMRAPRWTELRVLRLHATQVARAWSGKGKIITTVPTTPNEKPIQMKLNEAVGSAREPVACFKTVKGACEAKWLQTTPISGSGLPRGTERMLCLLQVGVPGAGKDAIRASANGQLTCTRVTPLSVVPLPAEFAASAQPRKHFFVPGGGSHALS